MAELGHNYNIQCMKLFQELKTSFPSVPDEVVRQCMKQNRNDKGKCKEDLSKESQNYFVGRYKNRALLSHQMEQLLKLDKELRQERVDMYAMRSDVQQLENNLKRQEIRVQGHSAKVVHVEVKQLEHDIHSLRGLCDNMSKKVTNLTGGKVPLGETSINFENYLSQQSHAVPDTQDASSDMSSVSCSLPNPTQPSSNSNSNSLSSTSLSAGSSEEGKWSCSECTFSNHPSLDTCEICEMPRITMGTNNRVHMSGPCFCHPQEPGKFLHFPPMKPEKPDKVFSQPKMKDITAGKENSTNKLTNLVFMQAPNTSDTCDSTEVEPPSQTSPCFE